MALHLVNKSPYAHNTLRSCLRVAVTGDVILLIEDGVYAALATPGEGLLHPAVAPRVLVLEPDLVARGVNDRSMHWVGKVDYDGFVALTETESSIVSWT